MNVARDVKGKNVIVVNDIVGSGGTLIEASKALKKHGAECLCLLHHAHIKQ